ncbi:MAG: hypothetical protein LBJ86_01345 [Spirochaetaceae bacterium]|jgi:hypothetical protein|nr:hypothetical protein [Spirochaetaceae bacterium]
MKKFVKSVAVIAALTFVFAACEQTAIGSAGDFPLGAASLNAVKGVSVPPSVWKPLSPSLLPFPNSGVNMVRGLASDGRYMVAVGTIPNGNSYATRYDYTNTSWSTPVPLPDIPSGVNVGAVHYLNGYYLATGGSTSQRGDYSSDLGASWAMTGGIGFGTKAGVYGEDEELYVVAGQNGQAAYTGNLGNNFNVIGPAITGWTTGTGSDLYINAGAYGTNGEGDGRYVFGGGSGRIAWTESILSGGQPVTWTTATATTGNWPFGPGDFVNVIAYGNGVFVAVGNIAANTQGIVAYSSDGEHWTGVTLSTLPPLFGRTSGIYALAFGNGYFAAADNDGNFVYSANGSTWTAASGVVFGNNSRVNAITYLSGDEGELDHFFVGGGDSGGVQAGDSN